MRKTLQGIALLLAGILLALCFDDLGWKYVGDLSLRWPHLFLVLAIAGLAMAFWPEPKDK